MMLDVQNLLLVKSRLSHLILSLQTRSPHQSFPVFHHPAPFPLEFSHPADGFFHPAGAEEPSAAELFFQSFPPLPPCELLDINDDQTLPKLIEVLEQRKKMRQMLAEDLAKTGRNLPQVGTSGQNSDLVPLLSLKGFPLAPIFLFRLIISTLFARNFSKLFGKNRMFWR